MLQPQHSFFGLQYSRLVGQSNVPLPLAKKNAELKVMCSPSLLPNHCGASAPRSLFQKELTVAASVALLDEAESLWGFLRRAAHSLPLGFGPLGLEAPLSF